MATNLFSPVWYRVESLRPALRPHIRVERHVYRDDVWFVLRDEISGRNHRVNGSAYQFVGRMDGRRTTNEIWNDIVAILGDGSPTQNELIELLSQLHAAEMVQTEQVTDVAQLFNNASARQSKQKRQKLNPLAFRVPLGSPTRILDALGPLFALFLKPWSLTLFLILLSTITLHALGEWSSIGSYAAQQFARPGFLLTLWFVYPVIKLIHEFAHGCAMRAWGAPVKEFGVTLMLMVPVPYVDASASSVFRSKNRRIIISLMGVFAELALAMIAYGFWLSSADGLIKEIAFAVMFTCTVSTLVANANPLMRFDGYYALADWLEAPNLAQRSSGYLLYLIRAYAFSETQPRRPSVSAGERRWLIGYGLASVIYRLFVLIGICFWVAEFFPKLALILAALFLWQIFLKPGFNSVNYLMNSAHLEGRRGRAWLVSSVGFACLCAFMIFTPVTDSTLAQGVVWARDNSIVRSDESGMVKAVLVRDGERVRAGQPILQLEDPILVAQLERLLAQRRSAEVSVQQAVGRAGAPLRGLTQELERIDNEIDRIESKVRALLISANRDGRISLPGADNLLGSWIGKGQLLGHLQTANPVLIRTVVDQEDIGAIRQASNRIEVRRTDDRLTVESASLAQHHPASTYELPSAALGEKGGGAIPIDSSDASGLRSIRPVFWVDVETNGTSTERIGARAWVRFVHQHESLLSWAVSLVKKSIYRYETLEAGKLTGS